METLLPSEIARLVLGYLEETECLEVAKMFLETSSYLQECRSVALHGKKFSTKVNGLTLTYILEKFWSINSIIQDKLSKLEECDELKNCTDLVEQLKLLIDVSRGQRFFVNISVPSQTSQSSHVLPIVTDLTEKQRSSELEERDKCKRSLKINILNNDPVKINTKQYCDAVNHSQIDQAVGLAHNKSVQCLFTGPNARCLTSLTDLDESFKPVSHLPKMYSTATDTLELMQYATAEVQTASEDIASESDSADTPVENLSLLTKELLNRTELHKRIAEKINQVLPADSMMKDSSITEIALGELNTSIMTELNNAIKSIVTATETDPVFEDFLYEIIGPNNDNEISPNLHDSAKTDRINNNTLNCDLVNNFQVQTGRLPKKIIDVLSSSNDPSQPLTEISSIDRNSTDIKNIEIPLDEYNAAAVQSIIDVNNLSLEKRDIPNQNIEATKNCLTEKPQIITAENITFPQTINEVSSPKLSKKQRKSKVQNKVSISNNSEITVPELIICPKEEIVKYLKPASLPSNSGKSQFIPIAPKIPQRISETVYLRTVNVPQRNLSNEVKTVPSIKQNLISKTSNEQSIYSTIDSDIDFCRSELITLYGSNAQNSIPEKSFDMPPVSIEDSVTLSGTGLSPYLKLNQPSKDQNSNSDKKKNSLCINQESVKSKNCATLTKRTPKSILKSRSKNCRLSLSTPRHTKNHVRVLNFNTPTENSNNYECNAKLITESLHQLNIFKPLCRSNSSSSSLASKSSIPILKGGWDKVSGIESMIKYNSQSDSDSPPQKKLATEETVHRSPLVKTWDADLRSSLNVSEKSIKSNQNLNDVVKDKIEADTKHKTAVAIKSKIKDVDDSCNKNKIKSKNLNVVQTNIKDNNCVVKKYAKLNTIATKISENNKKNHIESNNKLDDIAEINKKHLSNTLNLDTPRKITTTIEIPPTPRVLSPTNISTSITQVVNDDSTRIQSFLSTPEFPPTPNINLTPQGISVNTIDLMKKNYSEPYYQPSFELTTQTGKNQLEIKSVIKSSSSNDKIEITQFEVIKENLPKESTSQEFKISTLTETKDGEYTQIANASENDSLSSSCLSSSSTSISCYSYDASNISSKVMMNNKVDSTPKKSNEFLNFKFSNKTNELNNVVENNDKLVKTDFSTGQTLKEKKVSDTFENKNIETQKKNEAFSTQENTSETPVCSKKTVEILTNLTTKISELITTEPLNKSNDNQCKKNNTSLQANNVGYKKLDDLFINRASDQIRSELNEKRLRIIKKLNRKMKTNINSFKQVISKRKNLDVSKKSQLNKILIKQKLSRAYRKQNNDYKINMINRCDSGILNKNNGIEYSTLSESKKNNKERRDRIRHGNIAKTQTVRNKFTQLPNKNKKNKEKCMKFSHISSKTDNLCNIENNGIERVQENSIKKIENYVKSKVDMVKRDLFSDEENNENTVKLNQSRTSPNSIDAVQQINPPQIRNLTEFLDSPKEKLVVLESLKLVPSNKCCMLTEMKSSNDMLYSNHLEICLTYDDTDNKRRRRKLKSVNYNFKIQTGNEDNPWIQITSTPFHEMFSIIPSKSRMRKINTNTKPISTTQSSINCDGLKDKLNCNKIIITPVNTHPLATSSPIGNISVSKIMYKNESEIENYSVASGEKKKDENCKVIYNSRTGNFEHESEMIVSNDKAALDPKILLKQVDINKFLTEVHGPET